MGNRVEQGLLFLLFLFLGQEWSLLEESGYWCLTSKRSVDKAIVYVNLGIKGGI